MQTRPGTACSVYVCSIDWPYECMYNIPAVWGVFQATSAAVSHLLLEKREGGNNFTLIALIWFDPWMDNSVKYGAEKCLFLVCVSQCMSGSSQCSLHGLPCLSGASGMVFHTNLGANSNSSELHSNSSSDDESEWRVANWAYFYGNMWYCACYC